MIRIVRLPAVQCDTPSITVRLEGLDSNDTDRYNDLRWFIGTGQSWSDMDYCGNSEIPSTDTSNDYWYYSDPFTFTGLENREYYIGADYVLDGDWETRIQVSLLGWMSPDLPSASTEWEPGDPVIMVEATDTTLECYAIDMNDGYDGTQQRTVTWYRYNNGSWVSYNTQSILNSVTVVPGYTFQNLSPGTSYSIKMRITYYTATGEERYSEYEHVVSTTSSTSYNPGGEIVERYETDSIITKLINLDGNYSGTARTVQWQYPNDVYDSQTISNDATSSRESTYSGCTVGVNYHISIVLSYDDGDGIRRTRTYNGDYCIPTTPAEEYIPGGGIEVTATTENSITIRLHNLSTPYNGSVHRTIRPIFENTLINSVIVITSDTTTVSPTYTFEDLTTNTSYSIGMRLFYESNEEETYQTYTITASTGGYVPGGEIEIVDVTKNSITARLININPTGGGNQSTIRWNNNGGGTMLSHTATESPNAVYSNLSEGTEYTISAELTYYVGGQTYTATYTTTCTTLSDRPELFLWSEYGQAPTDSTSTYYIPKAVAWNALTSNINAVRATKGLQNYTFTTAVSMVTPITAAIYNEARIAIQGITGYGALIPTVSAGTPLYQNYWFILQEELNAIP